VRAGRDGADATPTPEEDPVTGPLNPEALNGALEHWPAAFGLAHVLVRDRSLAEDICQEAFLRLAGQRRRIADPDRVKPLLMTIVRNLAASEARRPSAESLDLSAETDGPLADPGSPDPSRDAIGRETRRQVRDVLDRLDPFWRLVLYLRDGLDFSYAEIAEVAARSEDVVRVTLHRARRRVREALERTVTGGRNHEPL